MGGEGGIGFPFFPGICVLSTKKKKSGRGRKFIGLSVMRKVFGKGRGGGELSQPSSLSSYGVAKKKGNCRVSQQKTNNTSFLRSPFLPL